MRIGPFLTGAPVMVDEPLLRSEVILPSIRGNLARLRALLVGCRRTTSGTAIRRAERIGAASLTTQGGCDPPAVVVRADQT